MNVLEEMVDVYGPVGESNDIFTRDRCIPKVSESALFAVMNAGA